MSSTDAQSLVPKSPPPPSTVTAPTAAHSESPPLQPPPASPQPTASAPPSTWPSASSWSESPHQESEESEVDGYSDHAYPFSFAAISIDQLNALEAALDGHSHHPAAATSTDDDGCSDSCCSCKEYNDTDTDHHHHDTDTQDQPPPLLPPIDVATDPLDLHDMMPGLIYEPSSPPSAPLAPTLPPPSSSPLSSLQPSLFSSSSSTTPDSPILSTLPLPPPPPPAAAFAPLPPPQPQPQPYLPATQNPVAPISAALASLDPATSASDEDADDEHEDEFDHSYMLGDLGHLQDNHDHVPIHWAPDADADSEGEYTDMDDDGSDDSDGVNQGVAAAILEDDDDPTMMIGTMAGNANDDDGEGGGSAGTWSAQAPADVPTEITRAAYLKGADIQGIDWSALPITRAKYRDTRNSEYASYRNTDTQVDPADKMARFEASRHMFQFEYTKLSTKSSFAHFQLRNLVWAPTKNDVFYTHDAVIRHWRPLTRTSRTLVDCFSDARATPRGPVRLSSMCAAEGVLVAGGYLGEYIIKPLDNARLPPVAGIVTDDPNGISNQIEVCRSRAGGAVGAVVASNDSKVRRMEVERRKVVQTLELGWPVNCAVQSPNRSMLAVVGDSTETRIFDAVHGDEIMQLHGHVDFSFAAAWSPTSPLLATGNQDRTTRIYDLRFPTRTLHTIKSAIGAVRSLRYAADGTLAIAEDADYVHLLCPRMQNMQSLDFFGEISGIAFTPDDLGDRLFVGNADEAYGSLLEFSRVRRAGGGAGGWWGGWEEVLDEKVGGVDVDEDEGVGRAGRDEMRVRYSIQGGSPGQYVEVDWGNFGDMFDIGMAGAELV